MKLYGFGPSRSIRVVWMLQELGVEYEFVNVDMTKGEHKTAEFLKINPAGKLPVLVDGDLLLTESVAINLYLAEKYPEKGFLPADLAARAHVISWLLFAATELEQPLWRMARHRNLYPKEKRIPEELPLARKDFTDMAAVLDAQLQGRQFLVGDNVTVADFVMAYTLDWANEVELLETFPGLRAYMERMYERPNAAPRLAVALASVRK
ncbi:MAG TPA: glutathione S-transferase family protein [Polyangiaceae bacterium]|nr:glutathione S-transferase family protein [Polyangiaceae bacterium]